MATFTFPPPTDPLRYEIGAFMVFHCAPYSSWNTKRSNDAIRREKSVEISVPYPKVFQVNNDMKYMEGGSLVVEMRNLEMMAKESLDLVSERQRIFAQGGSQIVPDHMETFLAPGSRRKYSIEFDLNAKTEAQAQVATQIANTFQLNTFPSWNGRNRLVWQHPPLWAISVVGNEHPEAWDGNLLPCVLKNVDINRGPILNTPFMTRGGWPLGLNIQLQFMELEPAVAYQNKLVNRAQIF